MSTVNIDPVCRRRLQPAWRVRNGMLVSAEQQGEAAALLNQLGYFRTKSYGTFGGDVTAPVEDKVYRFAGHIGPLAGSVVARILMAPADQSSALSLPNASLSLVDTSGNTIAGGRAYHGYNFGNTPAEVPSEWAVMTIAISVRDFQDTSFRATLQANSEARIISATVYETPVGADTDNGYVNQTYSAGQPILDEDRQALVELATAIYKRGGPSLFNFSSETDATAPTNTQNVYQNVIDGVRMLAKQAINPAGYTLDLKHSCRKTKTTVPVKIDCYAAMDTVAFGNGFVRVVDGADGGLGNTYAQFEINSTTPAWYSTTADLPADQRTYYVVHLGTGLSEVTTYAASCYRYE